MAARGAGADSARTKRRRAPRAGAWRQERATLAWSLFQRPFSCRSGARLPGRGVHKVRPQGPSAGVTQLLQTAPIAESEGALQRPVRFAHAPDPRRPSQPRTPSAPNAPWVDAPGGRGGRCHGCRGSCDDLGPEPAPLYRDGTSRCRPRVGADPLCRRAGPGAACPACPDGRSAHRLGGLRAGFGAEPAPGGLRVCPGCCGGCDPRAAGGTHR